MLYANSPMQDPAQVDLDLLDPADPRLFEKQLHWDAFARLRREDPVHYHADSRYGPFWSVTSHELIKQVDRGNDIFSSERGGIALPDAEAQS